MKKLQLLFVLLAFNLAAFAQLKNENPKEPKKDEPTRKGSYCCSKNFKNLVKNGNFEYGNTGFLSAYNYDSTMPYPGYYDIDTNANDFNASIKDHSYCDNPNEYYTNNMFMLVNGKTQQTGQSTVWAQKINGLKEGQRYKFCANFQDMEQCTFNVFPKVTMKAGSSSTTFTVNTDDNDPCDWLGKELFFVATGNSMVVQIILDEQGNGDGNDLAIDDIAVFKIQNQDIPISVQHNGQPNAVTASVGNISSSDDNFYTQLQECGYRWYVIEVTSFSPSLTFNYSSLAWGDTTGSDLPPYPGPHPGPAWNPTTNFPGYPFQEDKLYLVGIYVPRCSTCYEKSHFNYQLTFNHHGFKKDKEQPKMSKEDEKKIIEIIMSEKKIAAKRFKNNTPKVFNNTEEIALYPNPTNGKVEIKLLESELQNVQIINIGGQLVKDKTFSKPNRVQELNISTLAPGMYFIKATDSNNKEYNMKLMKE